MKTSLRILIALILVAILGTAIFLISKSLVPIVPQSFLGDLLFYFVSITIAFAILSQFGDVLKLVDRLFGINTPQNTPAPKKQPSIIAHSDSGTSDTRINSSMVDANKATYYGPVTQIQNAQFIYPGDWPTMPHAETSPPVFLDSPHSIPIYLKPPQADFVQVTVILDKDIRHFTAGEQTSFVSALSRITNVNPNQIRVIRIAQGSVVITLEMPKDAAQTLLALFANSDPILTDYHISNILGSPTPPTPFLAPSALTTFVGREEIAHMMITRLSKDKGSHQVLCLSGIGGIGKTSLAIHIAHQLRDTFDGGILWADLSTLRPTDQLAAWGRAYGDETIGRIENVADRAIAMRRILQGKATLAVLDGALDDHDEIKIGPLLQALEDCAVIVTTRVTQLPSLAHAEFIHLEKFTLQETQALFERVVGSERLSPRNLISHVGQLVDFLPLALNLAASQLREHNTWTLDTLFSRLNHVHTRLDTLKWGSGLQRSVRTCFDLSVNTLDHDEQTFFTALGAFGAEDFDLDAAAAVTGLKKSQANLHFEKLMRLSIVQEGRKTNRFKLHPLVRDFAREKSIHLREDEKHMAHYYCLLVHELSANLRTPGILDTLQMLDIELPNIIYAHEIAVRESGSYGISLIRDFISSAMSAYFDIRGLYADLLSWSEAGLRASTQLADELGKAAMLNNIGKVFMVRGQYQAAFEVFDRNRILFERLGDIYGHAIALNNLGNILRIRKDLDAALDIYRKSHALFHQLGDIAGEAAILSNIAGIEGENGHLQESLCEYEQSRTLYQSVSDTLGSTRVLIGIGNVYQSMKRYDDALLSYQQAYDTLRVLGDSAESARALIGIGRIHILKGNYREAQNAISQSYEITRKIGDLPSAATALINLGWAFRSQHLYAEAREALANSLNLSKQLGDTYNMEHAREAIAELWMIDGQPKSALALYSENKAMFERAGDAAGIARALIQTAILYENQAEYPSAMRHLTESLRVCKPRGDSTELAATNIQIGTIQMRQGNYDPALLALREGLAIFIRIGGVRGEATSNIAIGHVQTLKEQYSEAKQSFAKARKLLEHSDDTTSLARLMNSLGNVQLLTEEYDAALSSYLQSRELFEHMNNVHGVASALGGIANAYQSLGNYDASLETYSKTIEMLEGIGDLAGKAVSLMNLGILFRTKGDYIAASKVLLESIAIRERIGDRDGLAETLWNMAVSLECQAHLEDAWASAEKAIKIERELNLPTLTRHESALNASRSGMGKLEQG